MFENNKYYSLYSLVAQFVIDKASWERGKNLFTSGDILKWVELNSEIDSDTIHQIKFNFPDKTVAFFIFIYTFNTSLDFCLFGKKIDLITIENCIYRCDFTDSVDEKSIVELFFKGELIKFSKFYDNLTSQKPNLTRVLLQMNYYYQQRMDKTEIYNYLQYLNKTKTYIFPINGEVISISNLYEYLSKDEIIKLQKKFLFPQAVINILENLTPKVHKKIVRKLKNIDKYILPKDFNFHIKNSFVKSVLSIEFFMKKQEWLEIEKNYYLPQNLKVDLAFLEFEKYLQKVEIIKTLILNDALISKSKYPLTKYIFTNEYKIETIGFQSKKIDFSTMSLNEYQSLSNKLKAYENYKSLSAKNSSSSKITKLRYLLYVIGFLIIVLFFFIIKR